MIGGIILGVLFIAAIYLVSMWLYFLFRKKLASAKYIIEIATITAAMLLSIGVKAAILFVSSTHSLGSGFASILHAIYSSFGSLAFEGLDLLDATPSTLLRCLYIGSSLYVGLMSVSVITAKASYEIYSGVQLLRVRTKLRFSSKYAYASDIYVFTSVTEDSLLLADSIGQQYDSSKKDRNCIIIFTGDEIGTFDGKNQHHREIVGKGYLYWSFFKSKNESTQPSIIKRLGLYLDNDCTQDAKIASRSRIHIFALGDNSNLGNKGTANNDAVFGEISALTKEMFCDKHGRRMIVDLYVLTETDINYEYYQGEIYRTIQSTMQAANQSGKSMVDKSQVTAGKSQVTADKSQFSTEEYAKYFQLHIISEAVIGAKSLVQGRISLFEAEEDGGKEDAFVNANTPNKDNSYRAIVMGFGKVGQQATNALFIDTAYINKDGIPSLFVADVYDRDISPKAGLFAATHPMYVSVDCGSEICPFMPTSDSKEYAQNPYSVCVGEQTADAKPKALADYTKLEQMFTADTIMGDTIDGQLQSFDDVKKYMQFPITAYHSASCFDMPFLEHLDKKTGIDAAVSNKFLYNAFIIALGNDDDNIAMANALIDDIKHETSYQQAQEDGFLQTIYINIRNGKNFSRVNWTAEDKVQFGKLKVIIFGSKENIYSYKYIIDDSEDMKYHQGYEMLVSGTATNGFDDIKSAVSKGDPKQDYLTSIKKISNSLNTAHYEVYRKSWLTVPIFKKESNNTASRFRAYFQRMLTAAIKQSGGQLCADELIRLAQLEHNRWNRFYMANGWIYAGYDRSQKAIREMRKEHDCLCPFGMLKMSTRSYDLVNIALAYKEEITNG